jgi:hypothetical protein
MENSKYTALSNKTKPNKDLINYILCNVDKDKTIIDWGAGHGRHSEALRKLGYKVWSYDPYNGKDVDGYCNVSKKLPECAHDVIFSTYVLNVIPQHRFNETVLLMTNMIKKNGMIIHKVREDNDLKKKTKEANKNYVPGKKGSIQRYIDSNEFFDTGYTRNKKFKLYICNFV